MANGIADRERDAAPPGPAALPNSSRPRPVEPVTQDAARDAFEVWWSKAAHPDQVRPHATIAWLSWQAAWLFRTVELREGWDAAVAAFKAPSRPVAGFERRPPAPPPSIP